MNTHLSYVFDQDMDFTLAQLYRLEFSTYADWWEPKCCMWLEIALMSTFVYFTYSPEFYRSTCSL
jgi:hypothetical protein